MRRTACARKLRIMDAGKARNIACYSHRFQRNGIGELVVEHLARVAAAVPDEAQATAWLHEGFGRSDTDPAELRADGLTTVELSALELLTRLPSELYQLYVLRIAHAPGEVGRLARCVKRADLDDHLARERIPHTAPPYAWARRHIVSVQLRRDASLPAARSGGGWGGPSAPGPGRRCVTASSDIRPGDIRARPQGDWARGADRAAP